MQHRKEGNVIDGDGKRECYYQKHDLRTLRRDLAATTDEEIIAVFGKFLQHTPAHIETSSIAAGKHSSEPILEDGQNRGKKVSDPWMCGQSECRDSRTVR